MTHDLPSLRGLSCRGTLNTQYVRSWLKASKQEEYIGGSEVTGNSSTENNFISLQFLP